MNFVFVSIIHDTRTPYAVPSLLTSLLTQTIEFKLIEYNRQSPNWEKKQKTKKKHPRLYNYKGCLITASI